MHSWLTSANGKDAPFPIQNLPFGVARINGGSPVCVSAIGDQVIDLAALEQTGLLSVAEQPVFDGDTLNRFMAQDQSPDRQ